MKLSEALEMSQQHLSQLLEFPDVNGYGRKSAAVRDAREFEERFKKYVRSRQCCMNCVFCKPDDGALHVGRTADPPVCAYLKEKKGGRAVYINEDPAETDRLCRRFALKYDMPWKENEA